LFVIQYQSKNTAVLAGAIPGVEYYQTDYLVAEEAQPFVLRLSHGFLEDAVVLESVPNIVLDVLLGVVVYAHTKVREYVIGSGRDLLAYLVGEVRRF
jgi:hypothetical protein